MIYFLQFCQFTIHVLSTYYIYYYGPRHRGKCVKIYSAIKDERNRILYFTSMLAAWRGYTQAQRCLDVNANVLTVRLQ